MMSELTALVAVGSHLLGLAIHWRKSKFCGMSPLDVQAGKKCRIWLGIGPSYYEAWAETTWVNPDRVD